MTKGTRLVLLSAVGATLLVAFPVAGWTQVVCSGPVGGQACSPQTPPSVKFGAWSTKNLTFSCAGGSPYYVPVNSSCTGNYARSNSCFSITQAFSSDIYAFKALVTNWCLKSETLTIVIGCSPAPLSQVYINWVKNTCNFDIAE
jgi:hypothetical protein